MKVECTLSIPQALEARERGLRHLSKGHLVPNSNPMHDLEASIKGQNGHEYFTQITCEKFPKYNCVVNKNKETGKADSGTIEIKTTTNKKRGFWVKRGNLDDRDLFVFMQCDTQLSELNPILWKQLIKSKGVRTGSIVAWSTIPKLRVIMNRIDKKPPNIEHPQKIRFEGNNEDSYYIPFDQISKPNNTMFTCIDEFTMEYGPQKLKVNEIEQLQLTCAYDSLLLLGDSLAD